MEPIPFAITSYESESLPLSAQRIINAYAELTPDEARSQERYPVFGSPGLREWADVGTGPQRGFIQVNGVLYCVSGTEFYEVDSSGTATLHGTSINGTSVVSMDTDGFGIVIVNGTLGWIYTIATQTFAQIADPDFQAANTVTCIDLRFALDWKDTNKFFISELLDGSDYDSLSFASAESNPDRVLAVRKRGGVLLVFGETTIEPWDNTGARLFPFQRFKGGTIDRGIASPHAIEDEDQGTFILGNDLVAYRLDGLRLKRISTHAIEKKWSKYTTTSDAFCFKIAYGGHKFIYYTFPSESATWCYDIATGLWHERMSWDSSGLEVKWRANCAITVYNKTLIGDANSGRIGVLDPDTYTEFGDPIVTTLTSAPLHFRGHEMCLWLFEADMETGVGATTGQGSDPQIMLDYSDDGGRTYVAPQQTRTMGAIGRYETRIQWDRLGNFYRRVLRLSVSDPVKRVFLNFYGYLDKEE